MSQEWNIWERRPWSISVFWDFFAERAIKRIPIILPRWVAVPLRMTSLGRFGRISADPFLSVLFSSVSSLLQINFPFSILLSNSRSSCSMLRQVVSLVSPGKVGWYRRLRNQTVPLLQTIVVATLLLINRSINRSIWWHIAGYNVICHYFPSGPFLDREILLHGPHE